MSKTKSSRSSSDATSGFVSADPRSISPCSIEAVKEERHYQSTLWPDCLFTSAQQYRLQYHSKFQCQKFLVERQSRMSGTTANQLSPGSYSTTLVRRFRLR